MLAPNAQQIEHNTRLLIVACRLGNMDDVRRLFPVSSSEVVHHALGMAAQYGHMDIVEFFIPLHSGSFSGALLNAAGGGHLEVVQRLIPLSPNGPHNNSALEWAARGGHLEVVKLLLPVSDPKFNDSAALQSAVVKGHIECVDFLYPFSDPMSALNSLQERYSDKPHVWCSLETQIAERLHAVLQQEIDDAAGFNVQRKM